MSNREKMAVLQQKDNNTVSDKHGLADINEVISDLQKKYLYNENLVIIPASQVKDDLLIVDLNLEEVAIKVRLFEMETFVYEKDIKISYKLKSVFSALHSVNSTLIFKLVSDGKTCKIFIGSKSADGVLQKSEVLKGSLKGNFPGTRLTNDKALPSGEILDLVENALDKSIEITTVVGIPSIKDKEEENFIQGIENLILGMHGNPFSALFIGEPVVVTVVENTLDAYEKIYSVYSSEKELVLNKSNSTSENQSKSISNSQSDSKSFGTNESISTSASPWIGRKLLKGFFGTNSKTAKNLSEKLEGGIAWTLKQHVELSPEGEANKTKGTNKSTSNSQTSSISDSHSNSKSTSDSEQRTYTNKTVVNFLEKLDKQIARLEQGKGVGFWNVGAYFTSDVEHNSVIAANIYNGVIKGAESNFESSVVRTFDISNKEELNAVKEYLRCYEIPRINDGQTLSQAVTSDELSVQINFPHKSVVGLNVVETVPFGNNPHKSTGKNFKVGKLYNYDKVLENDIFLDYNNFTGHVFVTGSTGSGKSNVTYNLIKRLNDVGIPFLVIEPAKGEYKDEFGNWENVSVFGTNSDKCQLLKINPFAFPAGIHIYEHIDRFVEILNACWPMEAAMPNLLKEAIEDAYLSKGWMLDKSVCIEDKSIFPTFSDLLVSLTNILEASKFSQEIKSNYEGALISRVKSLTNGINKLIFTADTISDESLFDSNTIVDLSRVPSSESKALFMGILFMKLNEYRISKKSQNNSALKHITVLEEAHNLLKRTSSEQGSASANLQGKAVEMISNAIAEMRTYGEGFIIADQAPGLLDMSVIRNTNTKICLRLPDFEDRELIGKAMNLTDDQICELASLETGVAALYQNNWQEAILCKFDKFSGSQSTHYQYKSHNSEFKFKSKVVEMLSNYQEKKFLTDADHAFIQDHIHKDFLYYHLKNNLKSSHSNGIILFLDRILKKILHANDNESLMIINYLAYQKCFPYYNKRNEILRKINKKK